MACRSAAGERVLRLGTKLPCPTPLECNGRRPDFIHDPERHGLGFQFPAARGWTVQRLHRPDRLVCQCNTQDLGRRFADDPKHRATIARCCFIATDQRTDRTVFRPIWGSINRQRPAA